MSEQENPGVPQDPDEEIPAANAGGNGIAADEHPEAPPSPPPAGDEATALRERHLRLAAEFDNYRKRVERERSEIWIRAQAQLIERLLEPVDDLQRITGQDAATTSAAALHEGVGLVERKLFRVLEAIGVEEIEAEGRPFDPTIHEALTTVPTADEDEDNSVAQVYQKGYRIKGVLLRPARVVVRKHQG